MVVLIIIIVTIIFLMALHFYFRRQTYRSLNKAVKKWMKLPPKKYIKKCYKMISNRFSWKSQTWLKYPWRNFYFTNIWNLRNKPLPCHIQNALFQYCLKKKLKRNQIKTKMSANLKKEIYIHFHSLIKIKNRWVDVDVHQRKKGLPFGKSINRDN